ncbi:hypothetical protein EON81_07425, partial [bacterium]
MAPAQFWRTPFGTDPWRPLAGDADGDGKADLLAYGASGDSVIAVARTAPIGKPFPDRAARGSSGGGVIVAASGSFLRKNADVLLVFGDGSVKLVSRMASGTN